MVTSNANVTIAQKETCAVISMRDAVALLAQEKHIPYEDALLLFAGSRIYDALFDLTLVSGKKAQNIFSICIISSLINSTIAGLYK